MPVRTSWDIWDMVGVCGHRDQPHGDHMWAESGMSALTSLSLPPSPSLLSLPLSPSQAVAF